ncbi:hypothetical protein D3C81_2218770 [compost metagenome]
MRPLDSWSKVANILAWATGWMKPGLTATNAFRRSVRAITNAAVTQASQQKGVTGTNT